MSSSLGASDAPLAVRTTRPGWRDPRLWVGIVIVAASVVGGARLMAAADDSVAVWAVAADAGAGDSLDAEDLVARRVRFADSDDLGRYFRAEEVLPADLRLTRGIGAGELLPRAAVGTGTEPQTLQLPVSVDVALVPPSVGPGSVVDVHLTGTGADGEVVGTPGRPVLSGAVVLDAPSLDEGLAVSGRRQLVLGVSEEDVSRFFSAVAGLDVPTLTVVRRG